MFVLQAPYPMLQTSTYLPNPALGDSVNNVLTMNKQQSMDGTKYTYVKTRDRQRLLWSFRLTMAKKEELLAFYQSYQSSKIKVTDHLGNVYLGYFTSNPFEFEALGRSVDSPNNNVDHQIQIEFEGTKQ